MSKVRIVFALCAVGLLVAVIGCGKAKEVTQAARNVGAAQQLAQGGKATFEGENGEKVEMQVDKGNQKTTIKTDQGEMTTEAKVDPEKLGIEIYPGAQIVSGATVDHSEGGMATAEIHTPDAFDKVAKFYKDKYPKAQTTEQSGNDGKLLIATLSVTPDMKMITVTEDKEKGGTKAALQHTTETKKEGK